MTKKNLFINVVFLLIVIIFSAISLCSCALSNKRLCYDPECSVPVSLARTSIKYTPNEPGLLPFDINVKVTVYSKGAGNRTDLWGVEINGKRGYVPKNFLKEYKVLQKHLHHEVPTNQLSSDINVSDGKHKPKDDNDKPKNSAEEVSNVQIDSLVSNSTEETSHNVSDLSTLYNITNGATVPLEHNETTVLPDPVTEVVQATTIVPNEQGAVSNLTVSSSSEKVKSTIFAADDKLLKKLLSDRVENSGENFPEKVDINEFETSSEKTLDVPEIAGIQVPPLDVNASLTVNVSEEIEGTIQSTESNTTTAVKEIQVPPLDVNGSLTVNVSKEIEGTIQSTESNTTTAVKEIQVPPLDVNGSLTVNVSKEIEGTIQSTESNTTTAVKEIQVPPLDVNGSLTVNVSKEIEGIIQSTESNTTTAVKEIQVPPLDVNGSLTVNVSKEIEGTIQSTESNTTTAVKGTQSAEELGVIHVPEISVPSDTKKTLKEDVSNTNISEKSDIDSKEKNNTDLVEAVATDDVQVNTESVRDITNTQVENVKKLKDDTELKVEQIKSQDDQTPEKIVIENAKIKLIDNESSENTSIKNNDTDSPVPPFLVESNANNSIEVTLSSGNDKGIISGDILTENAESISGELNLTTPLDSSEVKVISDATVSSISQDTDQSLKENSDPIVTSNNNSEELPSDVVKNVQYESEYQAENGINETVNETINETITADILKIDTSEHINVINESHSIEEPPLIEFPVPRIEESDIKSSELLNSNENTVSENLVTSNEFRNRNLLNADTGGHFETENVVKDATALDDKVVSKEQDDTTIDSEVSHGDSNAENIASIKEAPAENILHEVQVSSPDICTADSVECSSEDNTQNYFERTSEANEYPIMEGLQMKDTYWSTLMYLSVTAIATLLFSLGYYYIENMRRDGQWIARINKLEKELLISTKECAILTESLNLTKDKLTSIEDESFGSNEMVLSLKADLEASQNAKAELEDQVAMLEKDLEGATEAGLELERMLREFLSSDSEVNPLAQSVEDLQARLNAQQAANESLTNALTLKTQENETLATELGSLKRKYEELEVELTQVMENLKAEKISKNSIEETLTDKVQQIEMQIKEISTERIALQKELKGKEVEIKDLMDVISRLNSNNMDFDKLYDVSRIKAEASVLLEERDELKERLTEVEGAHSLLEEHMKVVKEEVATLSEQCKIAEKEKKDAETRLEVLSSFFEEKEAQRQKEEAIWLQQQGEVVSTVEKIQTMQNEIQNYKQRIEMLKREIMDQEREYKNQISVLEMKAHEQWVVARQVERRLEESKVEAGQLRNRLTLMEKNINDVDSEAKLHRLEANGDTTTSPPLYMGAESSSSPIMFSGPANVPPPPPPSYLHSLFPPYLPPPLPNASGVPPYEVSQRPPPLGGRLSSPPPMPLHPSSRYDNAGSPPPMSPHLLPPFDHRSPPLPPFGGDRIHPPPPPPGSILPPPLGTTHSWGEESLPHPRNSGFHPPQRERVRNHKGSLHSSGESLDKTHHNSKV